MLKWWNPDAAKRPILVFTIFKIRVMWSKWYWTLALRSHIKVQWIFKNLICVSSSIMLSKCPQREESQSCSFLVISSHDNESWSMMLFVRLMFSDVLSQRGVSWEVFFPFGIQGGLLREGPFKPPGVKGSFLFKKS